MNTLLTNTLKLGLLAGAGLLLIGCAHEHHHDDREVVVVHEHRFDRPYYRDHDHHHGRYYAERDAYHGDHHVDHRDRDRHR